MSERLSAPAVRALTQANHYALASQSASVKPEHLLLALLSDDTSLAIRVLRRLGLDVADFRKTVLLTCGGNASIGSAVEERPEASRDVPANTALAEVMSLAFEEADRLGCRYVCTQHLLLGLVQCSSEVVNGIIPPQCAELASVREAVGTVERCLIETGSPRQGATLPASDLPLVPALDGKRIIICGAGIVENAVVQSTLNSAKLIFVGNPIDENASVELVTREQPDIVLFDMDTRALGGLAGARKVLGSTSTCLVLLGGEPDEAMIDAAIEMNAAGYIDIPDTSDRLLAMLSEIILRKGTELG